MDPAAIERMAAGTERETFRARGGTAHRRSPHDRGIDMVPWPHRNVSRQPGVVRAG